MYLLKPLESCFCLTSCWIHTWIISKINKFYKQCDKWIFTSSNGSGNFQVQLTSCVTLLFRGEKKSISFRAKRLVRKDWPTPLRRFAWTSKMMQWYKWFQNNKLFFLWGKMQSQQGHVEICKDYMQTLLLPVFQPGSGKASNDVKSADVV